MSVRSRISSFNRDVELLISDALSPKAQSRALAAFAREELARAQAQNSAALGRVPPHDTFVDGQRREDVDTVKPNGRIVFEFHLVNEVLAWISEQLVVNSPILTGRYVASHALFVDGVEIEPGRMPLDGKEYVFVNTLPYSRKIERGLSPQAPDGVYQAIAAVAARRFGNIARVHFTYRGIVDGFMPDPLADGASGHRSRDKRGRFSGDNLRQHNRSELRFPAIVVDA